MSGHALLLLVVVILTVGLSRGYIAVVSLILHVRDRIPINRTAIELLSAAAAGKCAGIY